MQNIESQEDLKVVSSQNQQNLEKFAGIVEGLAQGCLENIENRAEAEKKIRIFQDLWSNFLGRETSLQALLEAKQNELNEIESQTRTVKSQVYQQEKENLQILQKRSLLKYSKKLENLENSENLQSFSRKSREILNLLNSINEIGWFWRDTDTQAFEQSMTETKELLKQISVKHEELAKEKTRFADLSLKSKFLNDSMQDIQCSELDLKKFKSKLESTSSETAKLKLDKESLTGTLASLQENIEKLKSEKENLASKLEEIYEKLVNERTLSSQLLEDFTSSKTESDKLQEKLNEEKILKKRLAEQLEVEKENFAKVSKDLNSGKNLDEVLQTVLAEANQEGAIVKNEKNQYFFNGSQVNLFLHHESFLVVNEKNGPIPLTDFLLTAVPHMKSKSRVENSRPESEKSKSPLRSTPSNPRSKKSSVQERKKSFK